MTKMVVESEKYFHKILTRKKNLEQFKFFNFKKNFFWNTYNRIWIKRI